MSDSRAEGEEVTKEEIEELENAEQPAVEKEEEEAVAGEEETVAKTPRSPLLTLDKVSTVLLLGAVCLVLRCVLVTLCVGYSWLLAFTLWVASSVAFLAISAQKVPVAGRGVVITGCDTGFGHALALHLDKLGMTVFALCLTDGDGAAELRASGSDALHVIIGDVTKQEHMKRARKQVEELLLEGEGLWGLVNNAGVAAWGDVEWLPLSTFRRISEVNVFGTITATQAFLPLVRRAKGRIVNVASMLGRMGVPMRSPYVLSKFAVEGLSDCLRHELKQWGVSVVVVEPGNFIAGTSIFSEEGVEASAKEMWANMDEELRSDYGEELFQERVALMKSYITGGNTDLSTVSDAFVSALTDKFPQARYQPMDLYYKTRVFVASHLPEWVYDNIYVGCLNK